MLRAEARERGEERCRVPIEKTFIIRQRLVVARDVLGDCTGKTLIYVNNTLSTHDFRSVERPTAVRLWVLRVRVGHNMQSRE